MLFTKLQEQKFVYFMILQYQNNKRNNLLLFFFKDKKDNGVEDAVAVENNFLICFFLYH